MLKNIKNLLAKQQKKVNKLYKYQILAIVIFVKYFLKMQNNKKVIENIKIK